MLSFSHQIILKREISEMSLKSLRVFEGCKTLPDMWACCCSAVSAFKCWLMSCRYDWHEQQNNQTLKSVCSKGAHTIVNQWLISTHVFEVHFNYNLAYKIFTKKDTLSEGEQQSQGQALVEMVAHISDDMGKSGLCVIHFDTKQPKVYTVIRWNAAFCPLNRL